MSNKLTDLQIRILKALREHKKKDTVEIFSMDAFFKSLPVEVEKSRFQEDVDILESDGYILRMAKAFGKIGSYDIIAKGIKYLREIDE